MGRLLLETTGALLLLVLLAGLARAEDAVVVLDRGQASEANAARHLEAARRLVLALREREVHTRLVVYGRRRSGRIRAAELRGDPEEALAEVDGREGWLFEGPTDPRIALEIAVRRAGLVANLDVFLVGSFGGDGAERSRVEDAEATWRDRAPSDARILPVLMPADRRAVLGGAQRRVVDGVIVLAAGDVEVTPEPWSPLATNRSVLEADIRIPIETLEIGNGWAGGLLAVSSRERSDEFEPQAAGEGEVRFAMTREGRTRRVATLTFRPNDGPGVLWLVEPPPPRTFQWTALAADARLTSLHGGPPVPFQALDASAGSPVQAAYRLVRTRVGPSPHYVARDEDGEMPLGMDVAIGREAVRDESTAFRDVIVSFTPHPGEPLEAEGTLVLSAPDFPHLFRIPYQLRVPPGLVAVRLEAPATPLPLPASESDPPWVLSIQARNRNVPSRTRLKAIVRPPGAARELVLVLQHGSEILRWGLAEEIVVKTGVEYAARPGLGSAAGGVEASIEVALSEDQSGVRGVAEGVGRVRPRRPAIAIVDAPWAYRLVDGAVRGDPPLRLRLDADGGGGDWRLALLEVDPRVSVQPGAPSAWEVRPAGAGEWTLVPRGPWRGARPRAFAARTDVLPVRIDWPAGQAPGAVRAPVEIPARWGAAGWILVVLAALALALGLWGIAQLRPAPLEGTLLYTVAGRSGAVGRLDLAPAGRRARTVREDTVGRLHLGGKGPAVLEVRPTRVGGLLVLERAGTREDHLLVDGLTFRLGDRRLRYVSGREDDSRVPPVELPASDLLGPEFDLATGRIDALEAPGPPADEPTGSEEGDADAGDARS